MSRIVFVFIFICFSLNVASAHQRHYRRAYRHHYHGYRVLVRNYRTGGPVRAALSSACRSAARHGGPCGCVVAEMLGLPRNFQGLNLWLARDYYAFQRTIPHVGAVAIWGRHHVELVTASYTDGHGVLRVDTNGAVGFKGVPASRLTFVDPNVGRASRRLRHG
jgi:hypothetical protein